MTKQQHPITPSQELVQQWAAEYWGEPVKITKGRDACLYIATEAARWGWEQHASDIEDKLQKARDEEFEACCDRLTTTAMTKPWETVASRPALVTALVLELRAARRQKPPRLKKQMLARTKAILNDPNRILPAEVRETLELNQRALEAIPDE